MQKETATVSVFTGNSLRRWNLNKRTRRVYLQETVLDRLSRPPPHHVARLTHGDLQLSVGRASRCYPVQNKYIICTNVSMETYLEIVW